MGLNFCLKPHIKYFKMLCNLILSISQLNILTKSYKNLLFRLLLQWQASNYKWWCDRQFVWVSSAVVQAVPWVSGTNSFIMRPKLTFWNFREILFMLLVSHMLESLYLPSLGEFMNKMKLVMLTSSSKYAP